MTLEKDRLHVQLFEFVQSHNKRARLISLWIQQLAAEQSRTKKLKQTVNWCLEQSTRPGPGAKKKSQHAFCTDTSTKSSKVTFFVQVELNRAHRPWHLLLMLLHPASQHKRGAHKPAVKSHAATSTAGMTTVDLGPVADRLL